MPRTQKSMAFDFDPGTSMSDGLRTIRAALADEGLAIAPHGAKNDGVYSIRVDGFDRFVVPASRIVTIKADAEIRDDILRAQGAEAVAAAAR